MATLGHVSAYERVNRRGPSQSFGGLDYSVGPFQAFATSRRARRVYWFSSQAMGVVPYSVREAILFRTGPISE